MFLSDINNLTSSIIDPSPTHYRLRPASSLFGRRPQLLRQPWALNPQPLENLASSRKPVVFAPPNLAPSAILAAGSWHLPQTAMSDSIGQFESAFCQRHFAVFPVPSLPLASIGGQFARELSPRIEVAFLRDLATDGPARIYARAQKTRADKTRKTPSANAICPICPNQGRTIARDQPSADSPQLPVPSPQ